MSPLIQGLNYRSACDVSYTRRIQFKALLAFLLKHSITQHFGQLLDVSASRLVILQSLLKSIKSSTSRLTFYVVSKLKYMDGMVWNVVVRYGVNKLQIFTIAWKLSVDSLRVHLTKLFYVLRVRKGFGSRSFVVVAPTIWNSLPLDIRSSISIHSYRRRL